MTTTALDQKLNDLAMNEKNEKDKNPLTNYLAILDLRKHAARYTSYSTTYNDLVLSLPADISACTTRKADAMLHLAVLNGLAPSLFNNPNPIALPAYADADTNVNTFHSLGELCQVLMQRCNQFAGLRSNTFMRFRDAIAPFEKCVIDWFHAENKLAQNRLQIAGLEASLKTCASNLVSAGLDKSWVPFVQDSKTQSVLSFVPFDNTLLEARYDSATLQAKATLTTLLEYSCRQALSIWALDTSDNKNAKVFRLKRVASATPPFTDNNDILRTTIVFEDGQVESIGSGYKDVNEGDILLLPNVSAIPFTAISFPDYARIIKAIFPDAPPLFINSKNKRKALEPIQ